MAGDEPTPFEEFCTAVGGFFKKIFASSSSSSSSKQEIEILASKLKAAPRPRWATGYCQADVEDALQNALAVASLNPDAVLNARTTPMRFLIGIWHNQLRTLARNKWSRVELRADGCVMVQAQTNDDRDLSDEDLALMVEAKQGAAQADPMGYRIVELFVEGKSRDDIAEQLNMTTKAVKGKMQRFRERAKAILENLKQRDGSTACAPNPQLTTWAA